MGLESFCGLCLIAAGPAAVVYVAVIARKSFLVLLTLASAFYWLVVLMVISALVRGQDLCRSPIALDPTQPCLSHALPLRKLHEPGFINSTGG
ncbi:hypothetical protein WJX84_009912 [Apatococcus fuscideae]|uniref:Uncharacterized protein n=1 Tax=Apatococcus fuscideae TaxID=2026836 RepID=A0AAW1T7H9_9CHLO